VPRRELVQGKSFGRYTLWQGVNLSGAATLPYPCRSTPRNYRSVRSWIAAANSIADKRARPAHREYSSQVHRSQRTCRVSPAVMRTLLSAFNASTFFWWSSWLGRNGPGAIQLHVQIGRGGLEILEFTDEEIQHLVDSAVALLRADRIEPGEYQVITAPGVSGTSATNHLVMVWKPICFLKQRARAAHFIDRNRRFASGKYI